MSGPHRVVLADFKAKKRDEGAIDIELENGTTVRVDPPELWPDEAQKLGRAGDDEGAAVALLGGQDQYDEFVAGGGTAMLLWSIVKDVHGLNAGESGASSSS